MRSFVLFSLGLGLTACAADSGDESIVVSKNVAPGTGCTFSSTTTELFNPHGEVSVFAKRGYSLYPQLISRITASDINVEQRTIQVRGARVDLTFADSQFAGISGDNITHFESRFSAPLLPNGGVTDGAFELIPTATIDMVRQAAGVTFTTTTPFKTEVLAKVVVFGDLAGAEVVSAPYEYPVTICSDCVTSTALYPTCPAPKASVVLQGNSCNVYQDGAVDCCLTTVNGATSMVCPAPVATM